jgi:hypothetical protein
MSSNVGLVNILNVNFKVTILNVDFAGQLSKNCSKGVVHAWVGQKRLKSNILRRFFLPVIR